MFNYSNGPKDKIYIIVVIKEIKLKKIYYTKLFESKIMGKGKGEKYRHSTSMKHTVDSFIHPCGVAVYRNKPFHSLCNYWRGRGINACKSVHSSV